MIKILQGDCIEQMKTLPDESVHCVITSPPYWGLRNYGVAGQIGLEKMPEEYVVKMVEVFREVWRVLRKDGTVWLNLGDSYAGSAQGWGHGKQYVGEKQKTNKGSLNQPLTESKIGFERPPGYISSRQENGLKPKDLCGIPWRIAFALQADGWYLRQDIIWHKPNPMPESITDRCTKSHEYIFLLTKSARYFYDADAIKEQSVYFDDDRKSRANENHKSFPTDKINGIRPRYPDSFKGSLPGRNDGPGQNRRGKGDRIHGNLPGRDDGGAACNDFNQTYCNKRSVWTITAQPFKEAHFATFPPNFVKPCLRAGTSEWGCCPSCGSPWKRILEKQSSTMNIRVRDAKKGTLQKKSGFDEKASDDEINNYGEEELGNTKTIGWKQTCDCPTNPPVSCTVLDPFGGAGTTGLVAEEEGRNSILIELNPEYCEIAKKRTAQQGLFCK
jgi:DNA modification methylase